MLKVADDARPERASSERSFARLHEGPYADTLIPGNTTSTEILPPNGPRSGMLTSSTDEDWFRVQLTAGVSYSFSIRTDPLQNPLLDPVLTLYSRSGSVILSDDNSGPGSDSLIASYTPVTSGIYFVGVAAAQGSRGSYEVRSTVLPDPIPNNTSTPYTLVVDGASQEGRIETNYDSDYFRVDLVAGQSYAFSLNGSGSSPLVDPFLALRDASGAVEISIDDDGGAGLNALMHYTALTTGTYYLEARAASSGVGFYTIGVAHGAPQNPLDTITLGGAFPTSSIDVYFTTASQQLGPMSAAMRDWTPAERAAVMSALASIADVTNLTFHEVSSPTGAEFVFSLSNLDSGVIGQTFPGNPAYIEIDPEYFTQGGGVLAAGTLSYSAIIHEAGHALGLDHPQLDGEDVQVMQGVVGAFNSVGDFLLNQQVFTIMSYNDGWLLGPDGLDPYALGYAASPMALDIGRLQSLYGGDPARNAGDTTYLLTDTREMFTAIWDVGGADTMAYAGMHAVVIDLRAATLQSQIGGGGWVSFVHGVNGGFTIAANVVIENATGGGGDDWLTGNAAQNTLLGGDGNDTLDGGAGSDFLNGGAGDDAIVWDANDNPANLIGGEGRDVLVFSGAAPTSFNLTAHGFEGAEIRATDTGANAWAYQVTAYDAVWRLDSVTTYNDNSTRSVLDYDQANAANWATNLNLYDNFDRLDLNSTVFDDGATAIQDYDQASAFNWTTNFNQYDAAGALDINVTVYDTGVTAAYDYDQTNAFNWTSNWNQYTAGGLLDINVTMFDSGVTASNDFDALSAFAWTTNWVQYDAGGQLDLNTTVFDNGVTSSYDFDQANAFTWASNWNQYDAQGRLDINVTVLDTGAYNSNDFDQANEFDWTSSFNAYDTLGRLDRNITRYDNGDRAVLDYDQAEQFTWATMWTLYDSAGNVIGHQKVNDDGSVI